MRENEKAIGLLLPFVGKGGVLFNQSYQTMQQVRTNLKNLIMTIKGERWMQPNFGTKIYHKLFDQFTEDFVQEIIDDIEREIEFWMPYIETVSDGIRVYFASEDDMNKNIITIKISYSIKFNPNITDNITFKFSQDLISSD